MVKQGRADRSVSESHKQEPISKAVDPGAVDQIGQVVSSRMAVEQLYCGHGYKAPMSGSQTYPHGSQGRHGK